MNANEIIHKIQRLSISSSSDHNFIYHMQEIVPVIQNGPTCGIAAMCMAAQLFSKNEVSLESALRLAITKGITNRGEMFSAKNLMDLLKEFLPNVKVELQSLSSYKQCIKHLLLKKGVLLVPYDADANHEPCCRNGHKAHWALISGVLLKVPSSATFQEHTSELQDSSNCNIYKIKDMSENSFNSILASLQSEDVWFMARQSKSRHPAIWTYDSLVQSNKNLTEFSPNRAIDSFSYVLPTGGVKEGLCDKAIFIY